MGAESLAALVEEVRAAAASMEAGDTKTNARIDHLAKSLDGVLIRLNRPGAEFTANDNNADFVRKDAIGLCHIQRALQVPKNDGMTTYEPSLAEIDDAQNYRRSLLGLWQHGDPNRLEQNIRKALTSFSLGTNQFIMPPTLSAQILTCITDPTDLAGLVNVVNISGPSIKFMIDNARLNVAAWACEATCFANNPMPDLTQGLGEVEIKAESLRFIVCVGGDLNPVLARGPLVRAAMEGAAPQAQGRPFRSLKLAVASRSSGNRVCTIALDILQ